MSGVIDRRPVNEAVGDLLVSVTGRPIGRARVPTDPSDDQKPAELPYAILYPIHGGDYWGPPLTTAHDSMDLIYQVTSVGLREDQAQWMADKVRQAILGSDSTGVFENPLSISGINVLMRAPGGPPSGPVQESKIWQVIDRYKVTVSLG